MDVPGVAAVGTVEQMGKAREEAGGPSSHDAASGPTRGDVRRPGPCPGDPSEGCG